MTFFRSFVFNFAFWFWTGIVVIGCLPVLAGPRSWVIATQRFWSVGALVLARFLVGIRYEVRGLEHVPDGAAIFACKHQSSFETIVASVLLPRAAIVMKKELLGIPFYGWYSLRMGMIPVDRSGSAGAMRRMLRSAESAAEEGRPIVIFPEGTRAAAGTKGTIILVLQVSIVIWVCRWCPWR